MCFVLCVLEISLHTYILIYICIHFPGTLKSIQDSIIIKTSITSLPLKYPVLKNKMKTFFIK